MKHEFVPRIADMVRTIICQQLDVEEARVTLEASFIDDLDADSLGLLELTLALEAAFEIDIPDEDTVWIRTVQDAVDYVEKHAAEGGTPSPSPES